VTVVPATRTRPAPPAGPPSDKTAVPPPAGTAMSATNFSVAPAITTFSPPGGPPGTRVTVTGTGLTGSTAVKFNGLTAGFTLNSSTQITATVPANATSGPISATTPGGTATTAG